LDLIFLDFIWVIIFKNLLIGLFNYLLTFLLNLPDYFTFPVISKIKMFIFAL